LVPIDGPFPKLCPAVVLSHQDGRHSAVALLLKAALIQVSDCRLMGVSGYNIVASTPFNQLSVLIVVNLEYLMKTTDILIKSEYLKKILTVLL
jgi:hypothetical protein